MLLNQSIDLWDSGRTKYPVRPEDPSLFPEDDSRRWYDAEYAGWQSINRFLPKPPPGGSIGRYIIAILPSTHPYWLEYQQGLIKESSRCSIHLEVYNCEWDQEVQHQIVKRILDQKPDLVIFVPVEPFFASESLNLLKSANIPVIASNQSLDENDYASIISWTGPDDWAQNRLLARHFAQLTNGEGGYCIISHKPGTSPYLARVWGVRTELKQIAPEMECLDVRFTGFERERTYNTVLNWIDRYGNKLKGIISSDDAYPIEGVKQAIIQRNRNDLICVANGATKRGFEFVKEGILKAVTYQSPELDGMLALRTGLEWFSGIAIEPIRYLPACVVTTKDVDFFIAENKGLEISISDEINCIITEGRLNDINFFFQDLELRFSQSHTMSLDYFRGLMIEILASLLNLAKSYGLDAVNLFGGYEMLFRGLVHRTNATEVLQWLRDSAVLLLDTLVAKHKFSSSLIEYIISYMENHYAEPIALKTLSAHFGVSAAYLGKLFKERTGHSFSHYINELRINKAKILIQEGNLKLKDIAKAVGYAENSYFCTMFRKLTGVSPQNFFKESSIPPCTS